MSLDTPEYKDFVTKHDQWIDCLDGEDRNSVSNQLKHMIWNASVFRVINEARRTAPSDEKGDVQLNGMVHGLINENFFASQAAAIRRLTEERWPLKGKNATFSLGRLLKDMGKHAYLMTREHMLAVRGLQYDSGPVEEAFLKYAYEESQKTGGSFFAPSHLSYESIDRRHEQIDRLAGIHSNQRSRDDSMPPDVFKRLKTIVSDACEDVTNHADKFVAHAASPGDPQRITVAETGISLDHLWNAHAAIGRVVNFISVYLLDGSSFVGLAYPTFNQFKYIDQPLVSRDGIAGLREVWNNYDRETHQWGNWGLDDFEAASQ